MKKMRNANGEGSVVFLGKRRRKPYAIRITVAFNTDTLKQKYKYLGYFKTRKEAEIERIKLISTIKNFENFNLTFEDIYNKWSEQKFKTVGHSAVLGYVAAFKSSSILHNMKFIDIKTSHLENVILNDTVKHGSKRKIKVLFNQLFDYAMKNDIVSKDYSKYIKLNKNTEESTRKPFDKYEIEKLWNFVDDIDWIDTILILIYTGFRIGELLEIKNIDIDLENKLIKGGLKTEAGRNRIVPIHPKIFNFIKNRMNLNNEYLIVNFQGKQMKYSNYYREKFQPIMKQLNMKHKVHDTRHTFATLLSNAEANNTSVKKLIGHNSYVTTEKFYTHKDIEELRKAIHLI